MARGASEAVVLGGHGSLMVLWGDSRVCVSGPRCSGVPAARAAATTGTGRLNVEAPDGRVQSVEGVKEEKR